jgi:hypothetical protein
LFAGRASVVSQSSAEPVKVFGAVDDVCVAEVDDPQPMAITPANNTAAIAPQALVTPTR